MDGRRYGIPEAKAGLQLAKTDGAASGGSQQTDPPGGNRGDQDLDAMRIAPRAPAILPRQGRPLQPRVSDIDVNDRQNKSPAAEPNAGEDAPQAPPSEAPSPAGRRATPRAGIRVRPREQFVMIRNAAMRDKQLSLKAKGLLGVMLTYPDDWTFYMEHLEKQSRDGRDATRSAMKELIAAGYVIRRVARDENGRVNGWVHLVADYRQTDHGDDSEPQTAAMPPAGSASPARAAEDHRPTGNPSDGEAVGRISRRTGSPSDGKPAGTNTDVTKKKPKKKGSSSAAPVERQPRNRETATPRRELVEWERRVRSALGQKLLDELKAEDPRRDAAWGALSPKQLEVAFRQAQSLMSDPSNTRAFRTVLKERLDRAAGLLAAQSDAVTASESPVEASKQRRAKLETATRASEEAYDAAMAEGLSPEEAGRRAAAAYQEALG